MWETNYAVTLSKMCFMNNCFRFYLKDLEINNEVVKLLQ